jgi:replication factor C subunit 1
MDLGGVHKARKTCVIMDEVDGMSGNEDRGGIQTLIQIIKTTNVPIICICNDGGHPKVRSLKNYCEQLMWKRPTAKQIAPHIMAIAKAEGFKVDLPALEKLSDSCRADMRQILNVLQMWRKTKTSMSFDQVKDGLDAAAKDFDLGPFEVVPDFFRMPNPRCVLSHFFTNQYCWYLIRLFVF